MRYRERPLLALALLGIWLLAACAARREPIIPVAKDPARGPDLRVAAVSLGEELRWRTVDGVRGVGELLAVESDTLVLVERPGYRYSDWLPAPGAAHERRLRRIAQADFIELTRWDRQAEPYISLALGLPLLTASILLVLFAASWSGWSAN